MKSLRITLSDELESRFEEYLESRGVPAEEVVRDALRAYLESERGVLRLGREAYPAPERPLRFTLAERGSGKRDISIEHDKYLTED